MALDREHRQPGQVERGDLLKQIKGVKQLEKLSRYELDAVILLVKFEISSQKHRGDLLGEANARMWKQVLNKLQPQKTI